LMPLIASQEFGTDNGNGSYLVSRLALGSTVKVLREVNGIKTNVTVDASEITLLNEATAFVAPGVVPNVGDNLIALVWLAYASRCYFAALPNHDHAQPIYDVTLGDVQLKPFVKASWHLDSTNGGWLETLDYIEDGRRYTRRRGEWIAKRQPALHTGVTNASFRVTSWTNWHGLKLPARFALRALLPDGTNGMVSAVSIVGDAVDFREGCSLGSFVPAIPKKTAVIEGRLAADDPPIERVKYFTSDGHIRSLSEVKNSPEYAAAVEVLKEEQRRARNRLLIWAALVVVLALPVSLSLTRRLRRAGRSS